MFYSIGNIEIFKLLAYKLCTIVQYLSVRYAKTHYYAVQELDRVLLGDTSGQLCFYPLGKSVDGNN